MAESTFKTNPFSLKKLLEERLLHETADLMERIDLRLRISESGRCLRGHREIKYRLLELGEGLPRDTEWRLLRIPSYCHDGIIKLPEFQRSFVWDEYRIKSLIASVSRGFPIGALMSLETGGHVKFKPRRVEGSPEKADKVSPRSLLLDGQQRMTSLYQATLAGKALETVTPNNKKVKRWFYIDIRNALDDSADREQDISGVPEDRIVKQDFWHKDELNLSSVELEYERLMFPVARVFDWFDWMFGFIQHWHGDENKGIRDEGNKFNMKSWRLSEAIKCRS